MTGFREEDIDREFPVRRAPVERSEDPTTPNSVSVGSSVVDAGADVILWDVRKPMPEKEIAALLARHAHHLPPTYEQWRDNQPSDVEYPLIEISVRTRSGYEQHSKETQA